MQYNKSILHYFHESAHVGEFSVNEENIVTGHAGTVTIGEQVQLQLKIKDNVIIAAKFKAYGSVVTVAVMAYLTAWLENKTLDEAKQLSVSQVMEVLLIPETKRHCALLGYEALATLLDAVKS